MIVRAINEHLQPMAVLLIAYDDNGTELQRDVIPAGSWEYDRPGAATHWVFQAPGYQDAGHNDLMNYDLYEQEMIPKYRWLGPVLIGAAAYWVINKFF